MGAAATTGHVDSPATIVIGKIQKKAPSPKPAAKPRKGRKSAVVKTALISVSKFFVGAHNCQTLVLRPNRELFRFSRKLFCARSILSNREHSAITAVG